MNALAEWFRGLGDRDRRVVAVGAPLGALVLLAAGLLALDAAVDRAREAVARKSADLTWLQQVAPRVQSLPAGGDANEPLALLVDRTAREAGLAQVLVGATPRPDGGLEVRFEGAQFDAVVAWLSRLQQELGVRVGGAVIDAAGAPGTVNASLLLSR